MDSQADSYRMWSHVYVVFHWNFAAYIVSHRYNPCEFPGFVWTDCWGNKSCYVITSPANRYIYAKMFLTVVKCFASITLYGEVTRETIFKFYSKKTYITNWNFILMDRCSENSMLYIPLLFSTLYTWIGSEAISKQTPFVNVIYCEDTGNNDIGFVILSSQPRLTLWSKKVSWSANTWITHHQANLNHRMKLVCWGFSMKFQIKTWYDVLTGP